MAMKEWEMRQRKKEVEAPQREEAPRKIERFLPEARAALEAKGFIILELTGQSIKTLRDSGNKFRSDWHPDFEAMTSRFSEVAITPELFLPKSNRKTLAQQEEIVANFSSGLKIKGVEAIIGEAPDYAELAFNHLAIKTVQGNPVRLFGKNFGYDYTRTKTPTVSFYLARVGGLHFRYGLDISSLRADHRYGIVHVAPMIVPAGNK